MKYDIEKREITIKISDKLIFDVKSIADFLAYFETCGQDAQFHLYITPKFGDHASILSRLGIGESLYLQKYLEMKNKHFFDDFKNAVSLRKD